MSNHNVPQISVIIPTCHRNDLLALCLDCLAPGVQTLPPEQYEVIVTDDGSRSTAKQMIQERYPWAKWVAGPRRGPAANRNHGASKAVGEWLAFTDDDCLPLPGWLEGYIQALGSGVSVYEGKTTCEAGIDSPLYLAPINLTGGLLWSCNLVFHRELFEHVEGFDSDYSFAMEDIDMRDRLRRDQHPVCFVPDAVVDHPPRLRASGWQTGRNSEGYVRYWYKFGNRGSYWIPLLRHVKHGLYCLTRFRLSGDSLRVLFSLIVEFVYVAVNLPQWQKQFQQQYKVSVHSEAHNQRTCYRAISAMSLFQEYFYKIAFRQRFHFAALPVSRKFWWQAQGARFGRGTRVPPLHMTWPHQVSVGEHCALEPSIFFKYDGHWHPGPSIIIHNRVFVGRDCEFNIKNRVEIGDDSLIASGCKFIDHDHAMAIDKGPMNRQPCPDAPIVLEEDVWLGVNVVVLKGITIGRGAVVGAGAIVTKSIPSYEIWAGIPAKKVGQRTSL